MAGLKDKARARGLWNFFLTDGEAELALAALSSLPASPYKDALASLARQSVDRTF